MLTAKGFLGLVATGMGVGTCLLAAGIRGVPGENGISPGAFPMVLGCILALLGMMLVFLTQRRPAPENALRTVGLRIFNGRGPVLAVLFLLYCIAFEHLPFLPGSIAFLALGALATGERNPRRVAFTAVGGSIMLFLLFHYAFSVLLP